MARMSPKELIPSLNGKTSVKSIESMVKPMTSEYTYSTHKVCLHSMHFPIICDQKLVYFFQLFNHLSNELIPKTIRRANV